MNRPGRGSLALIVRAIDLAPAAATQLGLNPEVTELFSNHEKPQVGLVRLPMKASQPEGGAVSPAPPPQP